MEAGPADAEPRRTLEFFTCAASVPVHADDILLVQDRGVSGGYVYTAASIVDLGSRNVIRRPPPALREVITDDVVAFLQFTYDASEVVVDSSLQQLLGDVCTYVAGPMLGKQVQSIRGLIIRDAVFCSLRFMFLGNVMSLFACLQWAERVDAYTRAYMDKRCCAVDLTCYGKWSSHAIPFSAYSDGTTVGLLDDGIRADDTIANYFLTPTYHQLCNWRSKCVARDPVHVDRSLAKSAPVPPWVMDVFRGVCDSYLSMTSSPVKFFNATRYQFDCTGTNTELHCTCGAVHKGTQTVVIDVRVHTAFLCCSHVDCGKACRHSTLGVEPDIVFDDALCLSFTEEDERPRIVAPAVAAAAPARPRRFLTEADEELQRELCRRFEEADEADEDTERMLLETAPSPDLLSPAPDPYAEELFVDPSFSQFIGSQHVEPVVQTPGRLIKLNTRYLQRLTVGHCVRPDFTPVPNVPSAAFLHIDLRHTNAMVIQSGMGSGKSTILLELARRMILSNPGYRILIVTSRQALAFHLHGLLKAADGTSMCTLYQDVERKSDMGLHERLIIQCESLRWLLDKQGNVPVYDLVICDELIGILAQFSSHETHKQFTSTNWRAFYKALHCGLCFVGLDNDAFDKRVSLVLEQLLHKQVTYVRNDYKSMSDWTVEVCEYAVWLRRVCKYVSDGKRVGIACASRKKAKAIFDKLSADNFKDNPADIGIYTMDTDASIKRKLAEVNTLWMAHRVVIWTETAGVGVDYNPPDPSDRFDVVGHFCCGKAGTARSMMQQKGRARDTTEKRILCCIESRDADAGVTTTMEDIEKRTRAVIEYLRQNSKIRQWNPDARALEKLMHLNLLEQHISECYLYQLIVSGYVRTGAKVINGNGTQVVTKKDTVEIAAQNSISDINSSCKRAADATEAVAANLATGTLDQLCATLMESGNIYERNQAIEDAVRFVKIFGLRAHENCEEMRMYYFNSVDSERKVLALLAAIQPDAMDNMSVHTGVLSSNDPIVMRSHALNCLLNLMFGRHSQHPVLSCREADYKDFKTRCAGGPGNMFTNDEVTRLMRVLCEEAPLVPPQKNGEDVEQDLTPRYAWRKVGQTIKKALWKMGLMLSFIGGSGGDWRRVYIDPWTRNRALEMLYAYSRVTDVPVFLQPLYSQAGFLNRWIDCRPPSVNRPTVDGMDLDDVDDAAGIMGALTAGVTAPPIRRINRAPVAIPVGRYQTQLPHHPSPTNVVPPVVQVMGNPQAAPRYYDIATLFGAPTVAPPITPAQQNRIHGVRPVAFEFASPPANALMTSTEQGLGVSYNRARAPAQALDEDGEQLFSFAETEAILTSMHPLMRFARKPRPDEVKQELYVRYQSVWSAPYAAIDSIPDELAPAAPGAPKKRGHPPNPTSAAARRRLSTDV